MNIRKMGQTVPGVDNKLIFMLTLKHFTVCSGTLTVIKIDGELKALRKRRDHVERSRMSDATLKCI